jgi:hypothetical protein
MQKNNFKGVIMQKLLLYFFVVMAALGGDSLQAAASSSSQSQQEVILKIIKNGERSRSLTDTIRGKNGCKNSITGALVGCINPQTGDRLGIQILDIDPPRKNEDGIEKEVWWLVPHSGDDQLSHIRSNNGIFYLARSQTHLLLTKKKRGKIVEDSQPVFPLPQDVAVVHVLLEMGTDGKLKFSQLHTDSAPPLQTQAPVTQAAPPPPYNPSYNSKSR